MQTVEKVKEAFAALETTIDVHKIVNEGTRTALNTLAWVLEEQNDGRIDLTIELTQEAARLQAIADKLE